jgi:hypothetical protein
MKIGLIVPQFHAREHINVSLWIRALQQKQNETLKSFGLRYYGLTTLTPSANQKHYLAAFHSTDRRDSEAKKEILIDGLRIFQNAFGYASKSFVACNYVWSESLEKPAFENGVQLLQGQRAQLIPCEPDGRIKVRRHYTGERNLSGQLYSVRNCFFEPSSNINIDWVRSCISEIENAFFWRKPAIISTHRVNYVGTLDESNRSRNLELLKQLIKNILKKWPDVKFESSDVLLDLI